MTNIEAANLLADLVMMKRDLDKMIDDQIAKITRSVLSVEPRDNDGLSAAVTNGRRMLQHIKDLRLHTEQFIYGTMYK